MTDTQQSTSGTLHDATLDAEIQLVGDLVVAATGSDGPLTQEQIDAALGVIDDEPEQPTAPDGSAS
jgi:hypothetical protein